jgi:hypothetical protein
MTAVNHEIETLPLSSLIPYARNSRTHSEAQVAQIAASIREFGFTNPVLVDADGGIIAGHGRILAARKLEMSEVPCIRLSHLTEAQRRAYVIADNRLALNAGWDFEMLAVELDDLRDADFNLDLLGFERFELNDLIGTPNEPPEDEAGEGGERQDGAGSLAGRFLIAPFSVMNAREGWWQDRKRKWISHGIESEVGRDGNLLGYSEACARGYDAEGKVKTEGDGIPNVSIFDPVLCEVAYRWFSPAGGLVLDPFAGGSVRGVVASKLGRRYVGIELREAQVQANRKQGSEICGDDAMPPAWKHGDSRKLNEIAADIRADFLFSCPPYADLEKYSDDPRDLSTMDYADFREAYFEIIGKACAQLNNDRFACFVVGEVRDKRGHYVNFVGDTVEAFRAAGLKFYNEAILVTAVGTLPIRVGRTFSAGRKLGKTHQNILVFVKGDAKRAAEACGDPMIAEEAFPLADEAGEPTEVV